MWLYISTFIILWTLSWHPWICSAVHNHSRGNYKERNTLFTFHISEYTISNHALFIDVFCSPEAIHVPRNILGYNLVWPFQFVAVLVFGRFGLWPFRFGTVSVCGRFGPWPFRFVAFPVCGRFGLWPFRFVAVSVVAVSVCGRYDLFYSIHVPGWLQKWLNLITAPGSVSNEPGSVTWLATKYLKTVSWRNHTEKLTTWWPQNISFWPKINIPSSYFTILMLNCLKNTLKLQFDSYVTAVRFFT